jgi:hypothetical protein
MKKSMQVKCPQAMMDTTIVVDPTLERGDGVQAQDPDHR